MLALAGALRNQWPVLYNLMILEGPILEVGSGSGKACVLAKRLCPEKQVVALDVARQTTRFIRGLMQYTKTSVDVVNGDVLHLPFRTNSIGIVFSVGMLEHYPDDWIITALREQARIAKRVLVSVPLIHYENFRLHGDERLLTKSAWLRLLEEVAPLADISFIGPITEEYWLQAILDTEGD